MLTLQRLYGDAEAIRLVRASEEAVLDIEQFCADHGIDCEWRRDSTQFTATPSAQVGASDAIMDSRTFVHYYRSTTDGRLMLGKGGNTFAFGGRMLRVFDEPNPYLELLTARRKEFMPQLAQVPIAASWNGPSDRSGRQPSALETRLSKFAAAAGKADKA